MVSLTMTTGSLSGQEERRGDREQGEQERPGEQLGHPEQAQLGQEHLTHRQRRAAPRTTLSMTGTPPPPPGAAPTPVPLPAPATIPPSTASGLTVVAIPHGTNKLASSPRNTLSRIAEASSIKARSGPAYSST